MLTIQEAESRYRPHFNRFGLVTANGKTSDNDILWHAFYVLVLDRNLLLDEHEKSKQRKLFNQYLKEPGLLRRDPEGKRGQDSHDNLIAALWLSDRLGHTFHIAFLEHLRAHYYFYITVDNPTLKDWYSAMFFRFWYVVCYAKVLNSERLSCLEQLYLQSHFSRAAVSKTIESRTLNAFSARILYGHYAGVDRYIDEWMEESFNMYPNGLSDVFYKFGRSWRDHPFVEDLKGIV